MSIQFNDTTAYKGSVQFFEKEVGFNRGDVSGNTDLLKEFAADYNLAFDELLRIGFKASGTWQLDDSNHADYPEIVTNIVSGQRGNLILDIHRVMVADSSGIFRDIEPVDKETPNINNSVDTDGFIDGRSTTGAPLYYNKTSNGIFLDPIPNYNRTGGLKLLINREASYMAYTDTTKKPGVPGTLHAYLHLKPAMDYARRKSLACYDRLALEVDKYERENGKIAQVFNMRQRDVKKRMIPLRQSNK
jgi:hypothetical protein